jgi:galactose mutarotase-like enzyme
MGLVRRKAPGGSARRETILLDRIITAMTTSDFDGETAYVLRDQDGARAVVLPSIGNNCVAFQTPVAGRPAYLLSTPASVAVLRSRPTFWGFPILSPYPGRHQTPFRWLDKEFHVLANDRPGVALHGIVAGAPWEVVSATEDALTARFDSERVPDRGQRWPWPYELTASYRVEGGALHLRFSVTNRGDVEVPHLLGLHPYLPVRVTPERPLPDGALPTAADLAGPEAGEWRRSCLVWVEADHLWEMQQGLGTGTIRELQGGWDLRAPQAVAELEERLAPPPGPGPFGGNGVASGPRLPVLLYGKRAALEVAWDGERSDAPGGVTSGLTDLASNVQVTLESSLGFGSLALFCPPGQPFISLEPRSAVSDALTLMHNPSVFATGICPLQPGETWTAWARLSAAPFQGE